MIQLLLPLHTDKFHGKLPTRHEKLVCYEAGWKILSEVCDDRTGCDEPYRDKDLVEMVLTERRKKRDFDMLQDPRGAIVPVVPFLFSHSANYPEQCRVIKRNAFPDKLQIFR